ncbi:MAG: type II toxin-antitoxin system RelE/ParE family toxin [Thermosynechococcaceae cyanobacterium]
MPQSQIVFFQDERCRVPALDWLQTLLKKDRKGYANCIARIQLLADFGYELRRPAADYLRDGIYELRAKQRNTQYRILYLFHGQNMAILAHAITKEGAPVPNIDIERAIDRKRLYEKDPETYTYREEIEDD